MAGRRRSIDELQSEIQELFADLWQVPGFSGLRHGFRPQCDCFRTDDPPTLHVVLELPGTDPESIELAVSGRSFIVAGTRERPGAARARYQQMEIEYGPFQRRIELGEDVDASRAVARYEHGLLKVELPLPDAPPARAAARIAIEVRP
ncbi:MAG TPA: Hsp20/alpha crystallin family protein [Gaiellaceae bacterium]|jgi:HSP20 family protein|nr:Hsp20/alpha crystallin family protein [Gaiellaceae bacterium]